MAEPKAEIVPFGKYKGQPVEVLLADDGYRDWLMSQDWFRARFGNIYQTIINYGAEPQDTPEHNEMQASFLDDALCIRLALMLCQPHKWPRDQGMGAERFLEALKHPRIEKRWFEAGGWDVIYTPNWMPWSDIRVELKPDLGDDFPSVLRQVLRYPASDYSSSQRCVVVRRASFERVTWEQVSTMFTESGISLIREQLLDEGADA